jgi:hypothetical protein
VSAGRGIEIHDEDAPVPAVVDEEPALGGARTADCGGELRGLRDGHEPGDPCARFPEGLFGN